MASPTHIALEPPPSRFIAEHRSEEHTSELQSRGQLVCRLLLEKKKFLFILFILRKIILASFFYFFYFFFWSNFLGDADNFIQANSLVTPVYIQLFFFFLIRQPTRSTLFPYTTLFRS